MADDLPLRQGPREHLTPAQARNPVLRVGIACGRYLLRLDHAHDQGDIRFDVVNPRIGQFDHGVGVQDRVNLNNHLLCLGCCGELKARASVTIGKSDDP